jgi:putative transposase
MQPDNVAQLRLQLIADLLQLPEEQLRMVQCLLRDLQKPVEEVASRAAPAVPFDWPHSPLHRLGNHGTVIVTAGTCHKQYLFRGADRLNLLQGKLLTLAKEMDWQLEAWAVFSNHYHFVAWAGPNAADLKEFIQRLHGATANEVNLLDDTQGRQVWFNYWDHELTFQESYFARLNYVHHNAVKHGLVRVANQYPWCSAGWFERTASPAQVKTIYNFKIDRVKVLDDYDPIW